MKAHFPIKILLLIALASLQLKAQDFTISPKKYQDGIEGSLQMILDQNGYAWSWTSNTIFRFTPTHAEQIGSTNQYPFFTASRRLNFFEDKNGLIWIMYGDESQMDGVKGMEVQKLDVLDPKTKRIIPMETFFGDGLPIQPQQIFQITQDQEGVLWIGTTQGALYSYDKNFLFHFSLKKQQPIGFALPLSGNRFCLEHKSGWKEVDERGNLIKISQFEGDTRWFFPGENGTFWMINVSYSTDEGAYLYHPDQRVETFVFPELAEVDRRTKFWLNKNELWITDRSFFGYWVPKEEKLVDLTTQIHQGPNGTKIGYYQLYFGKGGTTWVNCNGFQLIVQKKDNRFKRYLTGQRISMRGITNFNDSLLWLNSYSGTILLNKITKALEWLPTEQVDFEFSTPFRGLGGLRDPGGNIWLGAEALRAYAYDVTQNKGRILELPSSPVKRTPVVPFLDKNGIIWMGLSKGLVYYSTSQEKLRDFNQKNAYPEFQDRYIQCFWENDEGIWTGTDKGLYLLDQDNGLKATYTEQYDIVHIYEDKQGIFWLSTRGHGLIRWDKQNKEVKQIKLGKTLKENQVHAAYEDDLGFFWLPTNHGLKRLNKQSFELTTYYAEDGLADDEFNYLSHFQDENGKLYFGGVNGLTVFHPNDFINEHNDAPLTIESIQVLYPNGEWKEVRLPEKAPLVLSADVKSLKISCELLDFKARDSINYAWQIDGYDKDWSHSSTGKIIYSRLPYGKYFLNIKGKGHHGEWSINELSIPLQVLQPFYLQFWFILLCSIGIILIAYLIILWRVSALTKAKAELENKVAERTKELEELNQMKDRLFAILGHELRGPLVSFQNIAKSVSFLLKKKDYERVEEIGSVIENTTIHINDLLDNLINWGLTQTNRLPHHPEVLDLPALTEQVLALFEPLAKSKNIELNTKYDGNTQLWADRNAILTILRNLVNNALKFTPSGGKVQIMVSGGKDAVNLAVKDIGVGMTHDQVDQLLNGLNRSTQGTDGEKGTGLGLALCAALAEQNKGKISIESALNRGTIVSVQFKQSIVQA